jgi:hypothetical protein
MKRIGNALRSESKLFAYRHRVVDQMYRTQEVLKAVTHSGVASALTDFYAHIGQVLRRSLDTGSPPPNVDTDALDQDREAYRGRADPVTGVFQRRRIPARSAEGLPHGRHHRERPGRLLLTSNISRQPGFGDHSPHRAPLTKNSQCMTSLVLTGGKGHIHLLLRRNYMSFWCDLPIQFLHVQGLGTSAWRLGD